MKRTYSAPVMYREAYIAEQYIAASDCGTHVGIPDHGHFLNRQGQTHCAFTASNCGENAKACRDTSGNVCNSFDPDDHFIVTRENGNTLGFPTGDHNCHILSSNAAAKSFVDTYGDEYCGAGVAALMKLGSFEEIETAFS